MTRAHAGNGPSSPNPARRDVARRLEADLAHREGLFVAAARRVRERDDPEAVHDLRVASRRLSEAIRLWGAVLDPRHAKRVRRRLRRLRREAGPIREMEATLELVRTYQRSVPAESRDALEPYIRRLRRRIDTGRRRIAKLTSPKLVGEILESSARARLPLRARCNKVPDPLLDARQRLARRRRTSSRLLATLGPEASEEVFHAARIAIKKDRYAEECWIETDPSRDHARAAELHELQRALGTLREHDVLGTALEAYALELAARGRLTSARELGPVREAVRRGRTQALAAFRRLAASLRRSRARPEPARATGATGAGFAGSQPRLRAVHPRARRHGS